MAPINLTGGVYSLIPISIDFRYMGTQWWVPITFRKHERNNRETRLKYLINILLPEHLEFVFELGGQVQGRPRKNILIAMAACLVGQQFRKVTKTRLAGSMLAFDSARVNCL